jgi:hypothetical protein
MCLCVFVCLLCVCVYVCVCSLTCNDGALEWVVHMSTWYMEWLWCAPTWLTCCLLQ